MHFQSIKNCFSANIKMVGFCQDFAKLPNEMMINVAYFQTQILSAQILHEIDHFIIFQKWGQIFSLSFWNISHKTFWNYRILRKKTCNCPVLQEPSLEKPFLILRNLIDAKLHFFVKEYAKLVFSNYFFANSHFFPKELIL